MEPVETYGHFTPGSARSLTGKWEHAQWQSGKRRVVVMRRGCNPRLRHALYHMARVALQRDAYFNRVYAALRAKGQRHGQALRNISDRLLRVLMAMLRHRTCYDASRMHCEPVV